MDDPVLELGRRIHLAREPIPASISQYGQREQEDAHEIEIDAALACDIALGPGRDRCAGDGHPHRAEIAEARLGGEPFFQVHMGIGYGF